MISTDSRQSVLSPDKSGRGARDSRDRIRWHFHCLPRMTWTQIVFRLSVAFQQLEPLSGAVINLNAKPVLVPPLMQAEERECAPAVDSIARFFARTLTWPAVSAKERFFLRQRLRFAHSFALAHRLASPFVTIPRSSAHFESAAIEWLLIDLWAKRGLQDWCDGLVTTAEPSPATPEGWSFAA
ncbi:MAG: hypothetical protein AB1813_24805 [Verrucomicrobiota bacterium]